MKSINVVKIGGNVVDNPDALKRFAADFAGLQGPKILIHGGGKEATRVSAATGIETKMIDGRRITDDATLEIVTMVYAGLINKRVVALLQSEGCDALGLSGADGAAITAVRRPSKPVDFGNVGDIPADGVNIALLKALLEQNITPVFCAITYDGDGHLLNSNADSVASAVATAAARIAPTDLTFCFEKAGVLADTNDPDSVISKIDSANYEELRRSGAVSAGMIPKIDNAFAAIARGVRSVTIKSSENLLGKTGTVIS